MEKTSNHVFQENSLQNRLTPGRSVGVRVNATHGCSKQIREHGVYGLRGSAVAVKRGQSEFTKTRFEKGYSVSTLCCLNEFI